MAHALQRDPTAGSSGGSIKILIAEDDPTVRFLVLQVVRELGHSPSCAENGAEALELYENGRADVVVGDWMMPLERARLDGALLAARTAQHELTIN